MILEVHLHDLIRESEHDGVACSHPLLHVDYIHDPPSLLLDILRDLFVGLRLLSAFKVAPEVLQKRHLLLKILGIFTESIFFADILTIGASALHVVEVEAVGVEHDFGGVVEEHASCFVAQEVAKTVLRRVVDPFFNPNFIFALGWESTLASLAWRLFCVRCRVSISGKAVHFAATDQLI